jgi:hypothetical protein
MMRKAKEVKVINRWKAEDFDGEIPIGGDEEMLGTAMKFASHMSGASEALGLLKKVPGPLMYFGFYGFGGAALGHTAFDAGLNGLNKLFTRETAYKLGFTAGTAVGNAYVNSTPLFGSNLGEKIRSYSIFAGSVAVGARSVLTTGDFASEKIDKRARLIGKIAVAFYTVAAGSYGYKKYTER